MSPFLWNRGGLVNGVREIMCTLGVSSLKQQHHASSDQLCLCKTVQSCRIWKELRLYTSISLYRAFPPTLLSKVGLPLPVSLFLQNRGGLVNGHQWLATNHTPQSTSHQSHVYSAWVMTRSTKGCGETNLFTITELFEVGWADHTDTKGLYYKEWKKITSLFFPPFFLIFFYH